MRSAMTTSKNPAGHFRHEPCSGRLGCQTFAEHVRCSRLRGRATWSRSGCCQRGGDHNFRRSLTKLPSAESRPFGIVRSETEGAAEAQVRASKGDELMRAQMLGAVVVIGLMAPGTVTAQAARPPLLTAENIATAIERCRRSGRSLHRARAYVSTEQA